MKLVEADAEGVSILTTQYVQNAWHHELDKAPFNPINLVNNAFVKTLRILVIHNYMKIFRSMLFIHQALTQLFSHFTYAYSVSK